MYQVFYSFRKYALIRLSSTYVALSIPTIMLLIPPSQTHPSNPTETETYTASLIAAGELSGILIPGPTPSDPVILRFTSGTNQGTGLEYEDRIEKMLTTQTDEITRIAKHMRVVGETLEMSKEYVDYLRRVKKGKETKGGKGSPEELGGIGIGAGDGIDYEDEDVMGDL
jgi:hypothetical protein